MPSMLNLLLHIPGGARRSVPESCARAVRGPGVPSLVGRGTVAAAPLTSGPPRAAPAPRAAPPIQTTHRQHHHQGSVLTEYCHVSELMSVVGTKWSVIRLNFILPNIKDVGVKIDWSVFVMIQCTLNIVAVN